MESIFVKFAQYPSIETERLLFRPVTWTMQKLCLSMPQTEKIQYTFPTNQSLEETKNNISQLYLANPFGTVGIELKALVSLSEPLTCTRLILFLRRQLLVTLSTKSIGIKDWRQKPIVPWLSWLLRRLEWTSWPLFTIKTIPHQERSWRNQVCVFPRRTLCQNG